MLNNGLGVDDTVNVGRWRMGREGWKFSKYALMCAATVSPLLDLLDKIVNLKHSKVGKRLEREESYVDAGDDKEYEALS